MIDLSQPSGVGSLWKAMKNSWDELEPFRKFYREAVRLYASSDYGKKAGSDDLVNILGLTATTYSVILAGSRPSALVTTPVFELKAFAKHYQTALNNHVKEIHFEETLRRIVLDAFFLLGVGKVYWAESGNMVQVSSGEEFDQAEVYGGSVWVDPGKIYVERVSMEDYGFDTTATSVDRCRYFFHRYRVPLSSVVSDQRFNPEVVSRLSSTSKFGAGFMGREVGPTANNMTSDIDHDDVEPMIDLMDVYLPMENKYCVFSVQEGLPPLYCESWNGPEGGPFFHLMFDDVPDNVMPLSPAHSLVRLHELMNSIMLKMAGQARRQKDITVYAGDTRDVQTAKKARDGEWVKVQHPELINVLKYGGVDQISAVFYQSLGQVYNSQAGNLDAMAGLGPQSETAKQDALLAGAVSRKEAKMKKAVVEFVGAIYKSIGWMMYVDANLKVKGEMQVPGLMFPVDASWTPEYREGDFGDYNFEVDVFSMSTPSPQEKYAQLKEGLNLLAPILPMAGGMIDPVKLSVTVSQMLNCPELLEVISFPMNPMATMEVKTSSPMQGQPPAFGQNSMSGQSNQNGGEYIHRTVPGASTPDAARAMTAQAFMTGGVPKAGLQGGVQNA